MPKSTYSIQQVRCCHLWSLNAKREGDAEVWRKEAKIELALRGERSIRNDAQFFLNNYDELVAPQGVRLHIRSLSMFRAKLTFLTRNQKEGLMCFSRMEPLSLEECDSRESGLYGDLLEFQAKYLLDKVLPRFPTNTNGWIFTKELIKRSYARCITYRQNAKELLQNMDLPVYRDSSKTILRILNFLTKGTDLDANNAIIDCEDFEEDAVFKSILKNSVGWKNEFFSELPIAVGRVVQTGWEEVLNSTRASVVSSPSSRSWILSGNGTPSRGIIEEHDLLLILKAMTLESQDANQAPGGPPFGLQEFQQGSRTTTPSASISQPAIRQGSRVSRTAIRQESCVSRTAIRGGLRTILPRIQRATPPPGNYSAPAAVQGFHLTSGEINQELLLILQYSGSQLEFPSPGSSFTLPAAEQESLPPSLLDTSFNPPAVQQRSIAPSLLDTFFNPPAVQQRSIAPSLLDTSFNPPAVQQRSIASSLLDTFFNPPAVQQRSIAPSLLDTSFNPPAVQQRSIAPSLLDTFFNPPAVQQRSIAPSLLDTSFNPPAVQQGSIAPSLLDTSFNPPAVQQRSIPLTVNPSSASLGFMMDGSEYQQTSEDQEMNDLDLTFWTNLFSGEESSNMDLQD